MSIQVPQIDRCYLPGTSMGWIISGIGRDSWPAATFDRNADPSRFQRWKHLGWVSACLIVPPPWKMKEYIGLSVGD